MKTAIIIPSRFGSTRFPGKPMAMIAGISMLHRVIEVANAAAKEIPNVQVVVATDDERIGAHCDEVGAKWVMTPIECTTGTDRVEMATQQLTEEPDFVLNLQGDAPLTPPDFLTVMIKSYLDNPTDVVTPVTQLSWEQLDKLRENKKTTPHSGTTAMFDEKTGEAFWFSKNITAIRKEEKMRAESNMSPIYRHPGMYGYSREMLKTFITLPEGKYEQLEGLEQLRVIEHGYTIRCVPVDYRGRPNMSGVDSPEDVARAEKLLANLQG
jgi:3-deoxy-manno-octulosonate cytidylyltransferase (CMP-KDO synthetase)